MRGVLVYSAGGAPQGVAVACLEAGPGTQLLPYHYLLYNVCAFSFPVVHALHGFWAARSSGRKAPSDKTIPYCMQYRNALPYVGPDTKYMLHNLFLFVFCRF